MNVTSGDQRGPEEAKVQTGDGETEKPVEIFCLHELLWSGTSLSHGRGYSNLLSQESFCSAADSPLRPAENYPEFQRTVYPPKPRRRILEDFGSIYSSQDYSPLRRQRGT